MPGLLESLALVDSTTGVLIAALLPYLPHAFKGAAVHAKLPKGYDLRDPRASTQAAMDGSEQGKFIARLQGAHQNGLESFPQWAAAVILAQVAGVDNTTLNAATTVYLGARLAYTYVYATNTTRTKAMLRSTLWMIGVGATVWLMTAAIAARK